MSKTTFPVNGGAMPAATLTIANLTDQQTGQINRDVYAAMVRREAMRTFGSTAPRYLRQAGKLYRDHVAQQQLAWRQRHGLPVAMTPVASYAPAREGVRRSAF